MYTHKRRKEINVKKLKIHRIHTHTCTVELFADDVEMYLEIVNMLDAIKLPDAFDIIHGYL